MSFLKVLSKVLVIGEKIVPPVVTAINPVVGQVLDVIFREILHVESSPQKIEQTKKAQVMAAIISHFAASGVTLDPLVISLLIDNLVAALNESDADKRRN